MDIVGKALSTIPEVDEIIRLAFRRLRTTVKLSRRTILRDFGDALVKLETTAFGIYKEKEARAFAWLLETISTEIPEKLRKTEAVELLRTAGPLIREFEFRAGQSRKSRGGSTWEKLGPALLETMGVRCEKPTGMEARFFNQIDRVVPSIATARRRPDQAIYLSFKRTTRERWRTLVDEGRLGYLYLVTQGSDITEAKLRDMAAKKIIAYVPESVKNKSVAFKESRSVRPFNELPKDLSRFL
jgi:hypothetical protein